MLGKPAYDSVLRYHVSVFIFHCYRIDEVNLLSSVMLHGVETPTLMILYEDTRAARHVKTYEINLRSKDKAGGSNFRAKVETGANLLIAVPAPLGGALAIGEQTITYIHPDRSPISINIEGTVIRSYGLIDEDGTRILLADYLGHLYVLVLISQGGALAGLQIERLGEVFESHTLLINMSIVPLPCCLQINIIGVNSFIHRLSG